MKTICIFGDSITWGRGLNFRVAWANLLRSYLSKKDSLFSLYDLGIDMDTSTDLLRRFDVEAIARKPEVIIFAIGTNDSLFRKPNKPEATIDEFRGNLLKLIKKAKKFTDRIVFVGLVKGSDKVTCPLKGSITGKCYSKKRIKEYSNIIEEAALKNNLDYISLEDKMVDEDFYDGVHPTKEGHKKIFKAVKDSVIKHL